MKIQDTVTPIKINYAYKQGREYLKSVTYNRWGKSVTVDTVRIDNILTFRQKVLKQNGKTLRTILDILDRYGKRTEKLDV